ncbi:MAG: hypothetical protein ACQEQE_03940 [Bacillota bacterium]
MAKDKIAIKKAWARKLKEFDDLPEKFKSKISKSLFSDKLDMAVYAPKKDQNKNIIFENILFLNKDNFIIFNSNPKDKIVKKTFSYKDILRLKLDIILLKSKLSIDTEKEIYDLHFNTTAEPIFQNVLNLMRKKIHEFEKENENIDISSLKYLQNINNKLFNYSKYALKFGNLIIDSVYQNKNEELKINPSISILTKKELIFIKEAKEDNTPENCNYGGFWEFIPINNISSINIHEHEKNNLFNLEININKREYIESYTLDTKVAFKNFDKEIKKFL